MKELEVDNRFIRDRKIPLGTIKPPIYYYDAESNTYDVPEKDIVYIKVASGQQLFIITVGQPGCGKSVLSKRILYYLYKLKYDCAVFDYKGFEWLYGALFGCPINLFPFEKEDTLPIVSLMPAHIRRQFRDTVDKYYKTFSFKINDIGDMQELLSLGFTGSASIDLMNAIRKNDFEDMQQLIDFFKRREKLHGAVRESIIKRLIQYQNVNFFDPEAKNTSLQEYWDKKEIPNFSMFSTDRELLAFIFGKIIDDQYKTHRSNKKFIMIDDCHNFAANDMSPAEYMSTRAIIHDIYALGRFKNWNILMSTQQPNFLHNSVINAATHVIFSRIGNIGDALQQKINDPYIVKEIKSLKYDKLRYMRQKLLLHDDGITYFKFYEWGPIHGHTLSRRHSKYKIF